MSAALKPNPMHAGGHRWVSTGHPEDDSPWCKNCGKPIEDGWGTDCEKRCEHEDTAQIHPKTGKYRSNPYADYVYRCEDCGAIGNPDGPNENGGEAIDWGDQ